MSTFGGRMKEYRFISLDRFSNSGTNLNLTSSAFFLSHCHQDHMEGLDSREFHERLKTRKCKLYCHTVTGHLLLCDPRYRHLEPFIETLDVDAPFFLPVPSDYFFFSDSVSDNYDSDSQEAQKVDLTITVTLLSAAHCPGSVMFLFEGLEGTVLYTGDFRLNKLHIQRMSFLHYENKRPKDINSIYVDTTFCTKDCAAFPSREQCCRELIEVTKKILSSVLQKKESQFVVNNLAREQKLFKSRLLLFLASKYGHEFLITELAKNFSCKVHVTDEKFRIYQGIPEIKNSITRDGSSTPIHACAYWESEEEVQIIEQKKKRRRGLNSIPSCPFAQVYDPAVTVVKPSMLWFASQPDLKEVCVYDESAGIWRLMYSGHSSLAEVRGILQYLKPKALYPNVIPYNSSNEFQLKRLLADVLPATETTGTLVETINLDSSPEADKLGNGGLKTEPFTTPKKEAENAKEESPKSFKATPTCDFERQMRDILFGTPTKAVVASESIETVDLTDSL